MRQIVPSLKSYRCPSCIFVLSCSFLLDPHWSPQIRTVFLFWTGIQVKELTLENPSSLPVLVQVVPWFLYPDIGAALSMATHSCGPLDPLVTLRGTEVFTLQDLEEHNVSLGYPLKEIGICNMLLPEKCYWNLCLS